ncbi:MAG TPA: flavin reductase family protein [Candidatus Saccharimonadales bacterium]
MDKIAAETSNKLYFTYPNTVAVICVKDDTGVYIMPAVWQMPLSHTPMIFGVSVSPKRHTYEKLSQASDFTLNYFDHSYAQLITNIGSCSGSKIDKIKAFNIQLQDSKTIQSPTLKDAFVSIECKKQSAYLIGDHVLLTGNVSQIWHNPDVIDGGALRLDKAKPLLYVGNFTYTTIDQEQIQPCDAYES